MKSRIHVLQLVLLLLVISLLSCQRYKSEHTTINKGDTYFSIKQYAADQIQMYSGVPHGLYRITHLNGQVDTMVANFLNLDWSPVFKVFSATDISEKKFVGQYDFSVYNDETTGSRGFIYTAKDPKLFTKTLQINTDPSNNRITSIYIETSRNDFWGSRSQKLLYIPMRIIQIQERQNSLFGKARNLRVDYRIMGEDEIEDI